jgi:hypothetical protein
VELLNINKEMSEENSKLKQEKIQSQAHLNEQQQQISKMERDVSKLTIEYKNAEEKIKELESKSNCFCLVIFVYCYLFLFLFFSKIGSKLMNEISELNSQKIANGLDKANLSKLNQTLQTELQTIQQKLATQISLTNTKV